MGKTIQLTLVKSLIIESVKNETFLRGQLDKADNDKAITTAYHEQAGDETYQERLLMRGLETNLSELLTHLSDYLSDSGQSTGDNIYSEESGDNIIITLEVSDRFNSGYTDPLAKLCSKYIEEGMLVDWWKPVNEKQSALYLQFLERDLLAIKRCFNKTAPVAPSVPYTSYIHTTGSACELEKGGEYTVTYELSDGAIDDVEFRIEDPHICMAGRTKDGVTLTGLQRGHTYVELYSRHNTNITSMVHIYVTDHT